MIRFMNSYENDSWLFLGRQSRKIYTYTDLLSRLNEPRRFLVGELFFRPLVSRDRDLRERLLELELDEPLDEEDELITFRIIL